MSVLIVIHGEFDEKQIRRILSKNIPPDAERSGIGAGRTDSRIDEIEFAPGEPCPDHLLRQSGITVHFGDGTADESDTAFFLRPEF